MDKRLQANKIKTNCKPFLMKGFFKTNFVSLGPTKKL